MSVKITFLVACKVVGTMESSLESFDASKHLIPKRIVNKIRNSQSDLVEISFSIDEDEPVSNSNNHHNTNGGIINE